MKINYLATILIATFGIAANVSEAKFGRGGQDLPTGAWIGVGVIAGIFLLLYIHDKFFGEFLDIQCPKCNEPNAMERASRKQTKGFYKRNLREWKCMYCHHQEWKKGPWIETSNNPL